MYKVILVPAGCGQTAIDVNLIEQNANTMQQKGYELAHIYQTSTMGCCVGNKAAVVMVFKQKAS